MYPFSARIRATRSKTSSKTQPRRWPKSTPTSTHPYVVWSTTLPDARTLRRTAKQLGTCCAHTLVVAWATLAASLSPWRLALASPCSTAQSPSKPPATSALATLLTSLHRFSPGQTARTVDKVMHRNLLTHHHSLDEAKAVQARHPDRVVVADFLHYPEAPEDSVHGVRKMSYDSMPKQWRRRGKVWYVLVWCLSHIKSHITPVQVEGSGVELHAAAHPRDRCGPGRLQEGGRVGWWWGRARHACSERRQDWDGESLLPIHVFHRGVCVAVCEIVGWVIDALPTRHNYSVTLTSDVDQ